MGKFHRIKFYEGLSKQTLVALWREQIEARELDLALYGPLFHDVFEPDFDAWRFYEDGTESGSSPAAAQDTSLTARNPSTDPKVHLRARVQEIGAGSLGGATTDDYGLEYSKNAGAYAAVTAASSNVQIDTASGLTADAATTNRATNGITDGSGSFVAGEQEETNGVIEDHQLTADNFTEHVWALTLIEADLADGDTLDFRITLNAGAPGMTNTVVPRITISLPVTFTPDADEFSFYEDGTEAGAALVYQSAPANSNIWRNHTITADKPIHLRYRVQETTAGAGATTDDYGLRYRKNGGAWTAVTASSSNVQAAAGGLTDGGATTDRLSAGTGSFVAGEQEEVNGVVEDSQLTASNYTNHVFSLTLVEGDLASGDLLEFQLTLNAGTPGMTNSVTPAIQVTTGPVLRDWKQGYDGTADTTIVVTHPPTFVEGDLLIVGGQLDNQAAGSFDTISGWTDRYDELSQTILTGVFSRIAGASEPATVSLTTTDTIGPEDSVGVSYRFDGHDPTTPIDVISTMASGNSDTPASNGVTTGGANRFILNPVSFDGNDFTVGIGPPTGTMTHIKGGEYRLGSGGSSGWFWAGGVKASAGATGAATWPSTTVTDGWHAFQIAIAPEVAGADTPVSANVSGGATAVASLVVEYAATAAVSPGPNVVAVRALELFRSANVSVGPGVAAARVAEYFRASNVSGGATVNVVVSKAFDIAAGVTAGASVVSSLIMDYAQSAGVSAGASVVASRLVEFFRSAAVATGASIVASRVAEHFRSANVAGGASVSAVVSKLFEISANVTAGATVTSIVSLAFDIAAAVAAGASVVKTVVFEAGGGAPAALVQLVRGGVRKMVRGVVRSLTRRGDQ